MNADIIRTQAWSKAVSPHVVDQEARDMATRARAKIESHEAGCEIRWAGTMNALTKIEVGMAGLYTRFWVAALSTITMLATACATLIYMVIHPG